MTDFADIIGTGLAPADIGAASTLDLAGKANTVHTHVEADTTNLVADLAGKAATAHTHTESDVTSLVSDLAGKSPTTHTHTNATLDAASSIGGVTGTTLAADHASWSAYTPTWTAATTNPTIGNGSLAGAYLLVGKTLFFQLHMISGSTTTFGTGGWSFSLPPGVTSVAREQEVLCKATVVNQYAGWAFIAASSTTALPFLPSSATVFTLAAADSTHPAVWANPCNLYLTGCIEVI